MGEIAREVQDRMPNWYGYMMRREEHCVGRVTIGMQVQGMRKRGRPKRRRLDIVRGDIKEKGL